MPRKRSGGPTIRQSCDRCRRNHTRCITTESGGICDECAAVGAVCERTPRKQYGEDRPPYSAPPSLWREREDTDAETPPSAPPHPPRTEPDAIEIDGPPRTPARSSSAPSLHELSDTITPFYSRPPARPHGGIDIRTLPSPLSHNVAICLIIWDLLDHLHETDPTTPDEIIDAIGDGDDMAIAELLAFGVAAGLCETNQAPQPESITAGRTTASAKSLVQWDQ